MFKRLFSLSNPLGLVLSTAAIILSISPRARKGTKKVLVKGTQALLSAGNQVKQLSLGAAKKLGTKREEAILNPIPAVPDSSMLKNMGEYE